MLRFVSTREIHASRSGVGHLYQIALIVVQISGIWLHGIQQGLGMLFGDRQQL